MAKATSKRGRPSKANSEKKRLAEQKKNRLEQRKQGTAIGLFALGVVLAALTFVPGENVWEAVRNALFGAIGVCAYITGPAVIYIAIRYAYGKINATGSILKFVLLALSVSGTFYCFGMSKPLSDESFFGAVGFLYRLGAERKGGGAISVILGWLLERGCGEVGAKIIVLVLVLVSVMLITGKTVVDLVNGVKKPIDGISERVALKKEQSALEETRNIGGEKPSIDISLDGLKTKRKKKLDINIIDTTAAAEASRAPSPIDIPLAGAPVKAAPTSRTVYDSAINGTRIDIPLGPETARRSAPPLREERTSPVGEIVAPVFEQKEKIDTMFTDFSSAKTAKTAADTGFNEPTILERNHEADPGAPYKTPPITLLQKPSSSSASGGANELRSNADLLVKSLESFGVKTKIVNVSRGPSVTRYELQPEAGVRLSRIVNLADDIALNLAASGVRIEAPIPGKAAVGIEIPNKEVNTVALREVIESDEFKKAGSPLTFALGRDIAGNIQVGDLTKMLHLLIAGSTGMGKSVCINSMIISLIYKSRPEDLQLILIDPKIVEFNCYNGLPHLYVPVVTDAHKAAGALGGAVGEMLRRYKEFAQYGARNIDEFNKLVAKEYPETRVMGDDEVRPEKKPRIVIVIDELADLMMTSPHEVEDSICRLAQMGRAAGIHLVVATQRPSVDVITGVIKNNIPTRIAFAVSSQVDSRTILDGSGAEKLIGRGDMLFLPVGSPKPIRIQGCYVSEGEVVKVVEHLKQFAAASYNEQFIKAMEENATKEKGSKTSDADSDSMLEEAIEVIVEAGQASTSFLQRRLKVGYARAARIMDDMEAMGIIGPSDGSKPRVVLMSRQQWQERLLNRQDGE